MTALQAKRWSLGSMTTFQAKKGQLQDVAEHEAMRQQVETLKRMVGLLAEENMRRMTYSTSRQQQHVGARTNNNKNISAEPPPFPPRGDFDEMRETTLAALKTHAARNGKWRHNADAAARWSGAHKSDQISPPAPVDMASSPVVASGDTMRSLKDNVGCPSDIGPVDATGNLATLVQTDSARNDTLGPHSSGGDDARRETGDDGDSRRGEGAEDDACEIKNVSIHSCPSSEGVTHKRGSGAAWPDASTARNLVKIIEALQSEVKRLQEQQATTNTERSLSEARVRNLERERRSVVAELEQVKASDAAQRAESADVARYCKEQDAILRLRMAEVLEREKDADAKTAAATMLQTISNESQRELHNCQQELARLKHEAGESRKLADKATLELATCRAELESKHVEFEISLRKTMLMVKQLKAELTKKVKMELKQQAALAATSRNSDRAPSPRSASPSRGNTSWRGIALVSNSIATDGKATASGRSAMDTITSSCTRSSRYSTETGQIAFVDRSRDPRTRPSAVNEIDRSLSPSKSDMECGNSEDKVRRKTAVVSPLRPGRMVQVSGPPIPSFPTEEEHKPSAVHLRTKTTAAVVAAAATAVFDDDDDDDDDGDGDDDYDDDKMNWRKRSATPRAVNIGGGRRQNHQRHQHVQQVQNEEALSSLTHKSDGKYGHGSRITDATGSGNSGSGRTTARAHPEILLVTAEEKRKM